MIGTTLMAALAVLAAGVVMAGEAHADVCNDPYRDAYPGFDEASCDWMRGEPFELTYEITKDDLDWYGKAGMGFYVSGKYKIDWGDGTTTPGWGLHRSGSVGHSYSIPDTYTVTITGELDSFRVGKVKPASLEQWGDSQWKTMERMFAGAGDMAYRATDEPDTSQVTSMADMFYGTAFDHDISHWDVSSVKDMSGMFRVSTFNQPLNDWDMSSVTDMSWMFYSSPFNQPLDRWDVSSVTTTYNMFAGSPFNHDVSSWDVSSMTDMSGMFGSQFNQPLNNWDVSGVTSMSGMFGGPFNQPLDAWNVSGVTDMSGMFAGTDSFNQPLDAWDVSRVTDMHWMFWDADAFNQDISAWNVSSVTTMREMFKDADAFNQDISTWNVSGVTTMNGMFRNADAFNQPLNDWDVSGVTDMNHMFDGAKSFNQPLDKWDVSNVVDMSGIFSGANSFNKHHLAPWYIHLDDLTVTDSDPVVGGISTLAPALGGDTAYVGTYRVVHPAGGPFSVDPGTPWRLSDGTPYVNPTNGLALMVGPTLVLDRNHGLEPGTYNVTIGIGLVYDTNRTVQVQYDGQETNRPPTAFATWTQTGQVVTLDGTGSWDLDGDTLTYQWRQIGGANVTLVGDGTATPAFVAPDFKLFQTFTFELVVSDGRLESQPSNSTVLVTPN